MAASSEKLRVSPTANGHLIRILGRVSFRESRAFSEFINSLLDEDGEVVVDLAECQHLDSTFLGCLLMLWKLYGAEESPRVRIRAEANCAKRLFGPTGLHTIIKFTNECPETSADERGIPIPHFDMAICGSHVLETHRSLAESAKVGAKQFSKVDRQIEADLQKQMRDETKLQ